MFRTAGLVARYDKKKALRLTEALAEHLSARNLRVYVEDTLAKKVNVEGEVIPLGQMRTDFVVTIGGDGTILRACASIPNPQPPVLAINMGIRGFLTEVEPNQAFTSVDKCLKGQYKIERCMKLSVNADGVEFPDALNEVVVSADEPAKLLYTEIFKDENPILSCQSDGLMVATRTGSTGYSLSAGGPVLDPHLDAFVLTPMCALTVFRSIVFPADSTLRVAVKRPRKMLVSIDGQCRQIIHSRLPSITVRRSKHETSFIRFDESFYNRLRNRLLFKGMR